MGGSQLGGPALEHHCVSAGAPSAFLRRSAVVMDLLVRAFNRAYFDQQLALRLVEAHREGRRLALLVVDADDFSGINQRWGRDAGDAILAMLARRIRSCLVPEDLVRPLRRRPVRGPPLVRVGRAGAGLRAAAVQPDLEHALRGRPARATRCS